MCDPVSAVTAIASVVGSVYSSNQQKKAAKKADQRAQEANDIAKQNLQQQEKAITQQEEEISRRNARTPNVAAILDKNRNATTNATLLTGPGGVDPTSLQLGKNTLLGQ